MTEFTSLEFLKLFLTLKSFFSSLDCLAHFRTIFIARTHKKNPDIYFVSFPTRTEAFLDAAVEPEVTLSLNRRIKFSISH